MSLSNNVLRIVVSVIAIPGIIAAAYFGGIYFFAFVLFIGAAAFVEFCLMAAKKGINPNTWLGLLGVLFLIINSYSNFIDSYSFFLLFIILISVVELFRNSGSAIFNIGSTLLGTLYLGLSTASLIGIREFYPNIDQLYLRGGYIIISVMAAIWICDSAAYYGGTALGKHKLFPRVSPNKSWEGAVFGFIFAIIAMVAAKYLVLNFLAWTTIIAFGIFVGTIGQVGDLFESLIKRDAGVKDSSSLIPGHGGIFDRFDSLLLTAPVILLYLRYIDR